MSRLIETLAFSALVAAVGIHNALADEVGDNKHVAVFIDKQNDTDPEVNVKINGEKYEFKLPSLSEGETRSIATEDGKAVVLNKKDGKVTAKIGDETLNLPSFDGKEHELIASFHGKPTVIQTKDGKQIEANTLTLNGQHPMLLDKEMLTNTLIISGAKLSEDEQKKVKEAIKKAGIKQDVKFVQGQKSIALVKDDKFEWSGSPDADHHVVILNTDGDKTEEKQIKIIRQVEKKDSDKK